MKFIVTRTSKWDDQIPVEGAKREKVRLYDYRTDDVDKIHFYWNNFNKNCYDIEHLPSGGWRGKCRETVDAWVIEIDNIIEFVKKVEYPCIVSAPEYCVEGYAKIEIYDDYRE